MARPLGSLLVLKKASIIMLFAIMILVSGCVSGKTTPASGMGTGSEKPGQPQAVAKGPPEELPEGVLVDEIPEGADVMFSSIRYVLNTTPCLDGDYELKDNFINDPDCNHAIYASDGQLAQRAQLFTLDIDTGDVVQITNTDCFFFSGQPVDEVTVMASAVCSDTDGNGRLNHKDQPDIYLLSLDTEAMDCLTCGLGLSAINNPDYSSAAGQVVFSAGTGQGMNNRIFTVDSEKSLLQLTDDSDYLDFDCSWSEDGKKIAFSRLPNQGYPFTIPSQVWLMNADGTDEERITEGGDNPEGEENQGAYPIGIDADPDLSPDNSKIVFSRLKSGKANGGFGIYELIVIDVDSKKEEAIDSTYANMLPEWKEGGIVFLRQTGAPITDPMSIHQGLYLYKDGRFEELEGYPYNVFPLGAYSASWIDR